MTKQRGFSLIELLIVVAIILIIAAIAVPSLLHSKISANEASAVASVRTLNTAEATYSSSWGSGYALTINNLGGAVGCVPTAATACIVDSAISVAPYLKSGYTFAAAGNTLTNGTYAGFEVNATPSVVGASGQRAFCSDQTGEIRFNTTGVAIGTAAGTCGTIVALLVGN